MVTTIKLPCLSAYNICIPISNFCNSFVINMMKFGIRYIPCSVLSNFTVIQLNFLLLRLRLNQCYLFPTNSQGSSVSLSLSFSATMFTCFFSIVMTLKMVLVYSSSKAK